MVVSRKHSDIPHEGSFCEILLLFILFYRAECTLLKFCTLASKHVVSIDMAAHVQNIRVAVRLIS